MIIPQPPRGIASLFKMHIDAYNAPDPPKSDLLEEGIVLPALQTHLEQQQRGHTRHPCQHRPHHKQHPQVPHSRRVLWYHVIISYSDQSTVIQQGDEHQHEHRHVEEGGPVVVVLVLGLVVTWSEREDRDEEEEQQLQRRGDAIRNKVAYPHKDASRNNNAVDNGAESWLREYDVSRQSCRIRAALYSDADVCSLQGGGVVHSITGHAYLVPHLSQALHDEVLVLGIPVCVCVCVEEECWVGWAVSIGGVVIMVLSSWMSMCS